MWGESEFQQFYTVSPEGTIFITNYGLFPVAGLTPKELENKLVRSLSKVYSGLLPGDGKPGTFLSVSLGRIHQMNIYFAGQVKQPGLYSISSQSTLFSSLFEAGGVKLSGSLRDIRVIRNNREVASFDLYTYLTSGKKPQDIRLQNNDIVFIPLRHNTIHLQGEVQHPALYELLQGEKLADLLRYAGGLTSLANTEKIEIERIVAPTARQSTNERFQVLSLDLNFSSHDSVLFPSYSLQDQDRVSIFPLVAEEPVQEKPGSTPYVSIEGHVMKPGYYVLSDSMDVQQLLAHAGGMNDSLFRKQTYSLRADLLRYDENEMDRSIIPFSLDSLLQQDAAPILLKHRDRLIVHSASLTHEPGYVYLYGEVKKPGQYPLTTRMNTQDLLLQAGGFTREAARYSMEIYSMNTSRKKGDTLVFAHREKTAPDMLQHPRKSSSYPLSHHDIVIVRRDPQFRYQQLVTLSGEVQYPGIYPILSQNETLAQLLTRAGGLTKEAFVAGTIYTRDSLRIVGDFEKMLSPRNNKYNMSLSSGDSIHIPPRPGTVRIMGEVYSPGLVHYKKGESLRNYIESAGSYTSNALRRKTIVYHPGGNAARRKCFGAFPRIPEGALIYIPQAPEKEPVNMTRLITNFASIASSIATVIFIVTR